MNELVIYGNVGYQVKVDYPEEGYYTTEIPLEGDGPKVTVSGTARTAGKSIAFALIKAAAEYKKQGLQGVDNV